MRSLIARAILPLRLRTTRTSVSRVWSSDSVMPDVVRCTRRRERSCRRRRLRPRQQRPPGALRGQTATRRVSRAPLGDAFPVAFGMNCGNAAGRGVRAAPPHSSVARKHLLRDNCRAGSSDRYQRRTTAAPAMAARPAPRVGLLRETGHLAVGARKSATLTSRFCRYVPTRSCARLYRQAHTSQCCIAS